MPRKWKLGLMSNLIDFSYKQACKLKFLLLKISKLVVLPSQVRRSSCALRAAPRFHWSLQLQSWTKIEEISSILMALYWRIVKKLNFSCCYIQGLELSVMLLSLEVNDVYWICILTLITCSTNMYPLGMLLLQYFALRVIVMCFKYYSVTRLVRAICGPWAFSSRLLDIKMYLMFLKTHQS